jgi:hypothetical protein
MNYPIDMSKRTDINQAIQPPVITKSKSTLREVTHLAKPLAAN